MIFRMQDSQELSNHVLNIIAYLTRELFVSTCAVILLHCPLVVYRVNLPCLFVMPEYSADRSAHLVNQTPCSLYNGVYRYKRLLRYEFYQYSQVGNLESVLWIAENLESAGICLEACFVYASCSLVTTDAHASLQE